MKTKSLLVIVLFILTLQAHAGVPQSQIISFAITSSAAYGTPNFAPGATSTNTTIPIKYISSDETVAMITSTGEIQIKKAGTVNITATQAGNATYSAAAPVTQTLTIIPAPLTIWGNSFGKVYGKPNPVISATYTGFVYKDSPSSLTTKTVLTCASVPTSPVGEYKIIPSGATDPNYTITFINGSITVRPAPLTITALNDTKTTGAANPSFSVKYTGFENGETGADLTTQPTITTTATTASPAGTYPITASGASDPNYTITYVSGTLTVNPAQIITFASTASVVYGTADFAPGATSTNTTIPIKYTSSDITVAMITSTGEIQIKKAGTVTITATQAGNATYGAATPVTQTLTITPAPLTIWGNSFGKVYGKPNPVISATYTGFVYKDSPSSLTTKTVLTCASVPTSPVGEYQIIPSAATDPNYTITFINGSITIRPAPLTITAVNATKTAGTANPAFTVKYAGFENGETAAVLTMPPTITTTATPASPAGIYPIMPSGAVDANYNITYVNGTLTIHPAQIITFASTASVVYGTADFAPGATSTNTTIPIKYASSDATVAMITSTGEIQIKKAGTVTITATQAGNATYAAATPVVQTLTVSQAPLTITADNQTKVEGTVNPTLTVSYNGFVNGDTQASLTTPPIVSTAATSSSNIGDYQIKVAGATAANYTITYIPGELLITPALVTFNPLPTQVYGAADFDPGATCSLPISYVSARVKVATIVSGKIHIVGVGISEITAYNNGTSTTQLLTVEKAPLTITADNKTKVQGTANPTLTVSYNGFVYSDSPLSLTKPPVISTTATTSSPAGSYPIKVAGAYGDNYAITFIDGTLTVTAPPLEIPLAEDGLNAPKVSSALSPNGDGINDVLTISNIAKYPDNKLVLINKSGAKIFEQSAYDNVQKVFTGKSNITGKQAPAGTYFYVLQYQDNGILKSKTGYLVIKY